MKTIEVETEKDKILYIDDEDINLTLFRETFSEEFCILLASSTKEAAKLLENNSVKVVVTDLRMPEENGIDFIRRISPEYPDLFFVILSAHVDFNSAISAINEGNAFRYLLKPWDVSQVKSTIKDLIYAYNLKFENKQLLVALKDKNKMLESALSQLKEREKQFFNIFYSSSDGVIIFNHNKEILLANPAFYNFVKISSSEVIKITDFLKGKQLDRFESRFAQIFDNLLPISEYNIEMPDGTIKHIEANSSHITYYGQEAILSVLRDITERKQMAQHVLNEVVQAEERERKRLATDLHDGLGPILSTLKMYIEWLSDKSRPGDPEQILQLSGQTIYEAIAQLREISYNLSPHILEKFGLNSALQSYIDVLNKKSRTKFSFQSNLNIRLATNIEISLFRILKECINNTLKHADAKIGSISIYQKSDVLYVEYVDDGLGFNMEEIKGKSAGMGLYNIQNRVNSLGGELEMHSEPNKGINIKICLHL